MVFKTDEIGEMEKKIGVAEQDLETINKQTGTQLVQTAIALLKKDRDLRTAFKAFEGKVIRARQKMHEDRVNMESLAKRFLGTVEFAKLRAQVLNEMGLPISSTKESVDDIEPEEDEKN